MPGPISTLCLDFGNTRQKAAIFKGSELQQIFYIGENLVTNVADLVYEFRPSRSILSSVIHHEKALEELLAENSRFHLLQPGSKIPFSTPVGKPETIGADRLALCAAAVLIYPKQNNLVIALGSAVTYNFINNSNEFLGGAISPGMIMRMKALNAYTAMLPIVDPEWNVPLVGYDTKTNIQSGVVLGLAKEIDGFIDEYKKRYKAFNVLLTGGDWAHLAPHLNNLIFADPDLLFKGLYAISEINDSG